jgi:23S rRNA (adenine2030-N6)-methyltransferase
MNYRHAFHAGNFADCVKHAALVWCVRAIQRKPTPAFFLDTHAGPGRYDLAGQEASVTSEWLRGIFRLREAPPAPLADFVALAASGGEDVYPGSPELLARLARAGDRVAACELHPDDAALLRRNLRGRAQVHARDGYAALAALLPPPERRGLVLIDPPYEQPDEFTRLFEAIATVHARFAGGVVLAWYPIKDFSAPRALHDALREAGLPDLVAAELWLREPLDAARLNGCGLVVKNPPFGFELAAREILDALLARLSDGEAGAGTRVVRITAE